MKLNFWQWIGAILFVAGLLFLIIRESGKSSPSSTTPAATAPANQ